MLFDSNGVDPTAPVVVGMILGPLDRLSGADDVAVLVAGGAQRLGAAQAAEAAQALKGVEPGVANAAQPASNVRGADGVSVRGADGVNRSRPTPSPERAVSPGQRDRPQPASASHEGG